MSKPAPTLEVKRDLNDTRLSYSSYQTVKGCEQKYWHYKINDTPKDSDYVDEKESLMLGKAFHSILEFTRHTDNNLAEGIKLAQSAYGDFIEEDKMALVVAMVKTYLKAKNNHEKFKTLEPVGVEVAIEDDEFLGFVDVVFKDESGSWFIGDLKTTARQSENLKARLEMDAQLNLYSNYREQIADKLGLDVTKFSGSLYITTNKTTTKRKAGEKLSDYVTRLEPAIETRVYVVPFSQEKANWVHVDFLGWHSRTKGLRKGSKPDRNYSRCEDYFSPCPYFSQCHGHNYSEATLETWSSNEL